MTPSNSTLSDTGPGCVRHRQGAGARRQGGLALAAPLRVLAGLLVSVLSMTSLAAQAQATDPTVAGEVLLRLRSNDALAPLLAKYRLSLVDRFGARPIFRLKVTGAASVADTLNGLAGEADVLGAEANVVHSSPEARKNNVFAIGTEQAYAQQWAPQALRLAEAHQWSTGAGVRVAVLDTGVDRQHPALAGRLLPGFDFVDFDTDPSEAGSPASSGFGHGTHVAGLVARVAPGAMIMPLRVLDANGQGNVWVLAEALLYAVDPDGNPQTDDGAQVINLSLGSSTRTQLMATLTTLASCSLPVATDPAALEFADAGYNDDKLRCAGSRGAVVVAAAGNAASKSLREYPAAESAYGLLAVAASRSDNRLAAFSNYGSWVHLAAPGEAITSTVPGGYGTWSGTSMAAPMVAGSAALLRSAAPGLSSRLLARRLECTSASLRDSKLRRVDPLAALATVVGRDTGCP